MTPLSIRKTIVPYLADLGAVVYVAAAMLIVLAVLAELLSPGFVATAIAPQALVVMAVAGGLLSLLEPRDRRRSATSRIAFVVSGTAITVFAGWSAWQYFSPVPDARPWLAAAITATVGLTFFLFYE